MLIVNVNVEHLLKVNTKLYVIQHRKVKSVSFRLLQIYLLPKKYFTDACKFVLIIKTKAKVSP